MLMMLKVFKVFSASPLGASDASDGRLVLALLDPAVPARGGVLGSVLAIPASSAAGLKLMMVSLPAVGVAAVVAFV